MNLFKKKKVSSHSTDLQDFRRILSDDTPFAIREAFRTLYTNVLYLPIEDKCKKIVLTSAFAGEGKTYVSVNLALTIVSNAPDSRVLLVDADMRNPRVTRILKMKKTGTHGFSEYLAGIDDNPNFLDTNYPNLKILSSGAKNSNTLGLISSSRMQELMDFCSDKFDYIIFDTPPVNIVADSGLLSDYVNGYLLVTRADYSDINSVAEMLENLSRVNANIFGFVLTSVNLQKNKYGRYGRYGKYGKYSGYYYGSYKKNANGTEKPVSMPDTDSEDK